MTDKALKQQLIEVVDDVYIRSLKHNICRYANVLTKDLLDHLYSTYSNIMPENLNKKEKQMKTSCDMAQPFATFRLQIEEARAFEKVESAPYTEAQVLDIAYQVLNEIRFFNDACCRWRQKAAVQKNWRNFKSHFKSEHDD